MDYMNMSEVSSICNKVDHLLKGASRSNPTKQIRQYDMCDRWREGYDSSLQTETRYSSDKTTKTYTLIANSTIQLCWPIPFVVIVVCQIVEVVSSAINFLSSKPQAITKIFSPGILDSGSLREKFGILWYLLFYFLNGSTYL